MCFAPVSSWGVIFVDAEDAKFLREYVWSQNASYSYRTQYAVSPTFARQNDTSRYLHLAVLGIQQKKWMAYMTVEGKKIWLGRFGFESDAAICYNYHAAHYFGDFAGPNDLTRIEYMYD